MPADFLSRFRIDHSQWSAAISRMKSATHELAVSTRVVGQHAQWSAMQSATAYQRQQQQMQMLTSMTNQLAFRLGVAAAAWGALSIAATKAAIDQESAFTGVLKTVNDTEENLNRFRRELTALSNRTPVRFTDLSRIGELAGQLGVRGVENLTKFTETIARISVSTNLSAEAAAKSFARLSNVMQEPIQNVDRIGAAVVDLGNNFATTEQEITEFAERLSGSAKIARMTTADVLAISTAMSSVGVEAEAGGTAVQKMMVAMTQSVAMSDEKLRAFSELANTTAEGFQNLFRAKPIEAFTRVVEGLGRAGESAFAFIDDITGNEARFTRAFLSLANAGGLLRAAVETSNQAWKANSALMTESNRRFATTESTLQTLRNVLQNAASSFMERLLPAIQATTVSVIAFVQRLQELPDWVKAVTVTVSAAGAAFLSLSAASLFVVGSLAASKAASVIAGVSVAALAVKLGLAAAAAGALAAALYLFYKNSGGFLTTQELLGKQEQDIAEALKNEREQLERLQRVRLPEREWQAAEIKRRQDRVTMLEREYASIKTTNEQLAKEEQHRQHLNKTLEAMNEQMRKRGFEPEAVIKEEQRQALEDLVLNLSILKSVTDPATAAFMRQQIEIGKQAKSMGQLSKAYRYFAEESAKVTKAQADAQHALKLVGTEYERATRALELSAQRRELDAERRTISTQELLDAEADALKERQRLIDQRFREELRLADQSGQAQRDLIEDAANRRRQAMDQLSADVMKHEKKLLDYRRGVYQDMIVLVMDAEERRLTLESTVAAEREALTREMIQLGETEVEAAKRNAVEEYAARSEKILATVTDYQSAAGLIAQAWQVARRKMDDADNKFFLSESDRHEQRRQALDTLLHSETERVDREYGERLGLLIVYAEKEYGEGFMQHKRFLDAKKRLDDDYYGKRHQARVNDFKDVNAKLAQEIDANEKILNEKLSNIQKVSDASTKAAQLTASINMYAARVSGNVWAFIRAKVDGVVAAMDNSFDAIGRGIDEFARGAHQALSDLLFDWFTGQAVRMADVWRSMLRSMVRSISDFLAQAIVKQFLMFLASAMGRGGVTAAQPIVNSAGQIIGYTMQNQSSTTGAMTGMGVGLGAFLSAAGPAASAAAGSGFVSPQTAGMVNVGAGLLNMWSAAGGGVNAAGRVAFPTNLSGLASLQGGLGAASLAGGAMQMMSSNPHVQRGGAALSSLGLLASSPLLATVGSVATIGFNTYNAIQGLQDQNANQGAAIGTLGGMAIGAAIGTMIAPGIGTLIGAAIGSSAGSFLGGLFGKTGVPHKVREARELQSTLAHAGAFQSQLVGSGSLGELYGRLVAQTSGYYGGSSGGNAVITGVRGPVPFAGMTPPVGFPSMEAYLRAKYVGNPAYPNAAAEVAAGLVPGTGAVYFGRPNPYEPTIGLTEFKRMARTGDLGRTMALIQAGVTPSSLTGANESLRSTIVALATALSEIEVAFERDIERLQKRISPFLIGDEVDRFADAMQRVRDAFDRAGVQAAQDVLKKFEEQEKGLVDRITAQFEALQQALASALQAGFQATSVDGAITAFAQDLRQQVLNAVGQGLVQAVLDSEAFQGILTPTLVPIRELVSRIASASPADLTADFFGARRTELQGILAGVSERLGPMIPVLRELFGFTSTLGTFLSPSEISGLVGSSDMTGQIPHRPRFASGGWVSALGGTVEEGEFVVNPHSARQNADVLEDINATGRTGGVTVNMVVNIQGATRSPRELARELAREIQDELNRLNDRRYSVSGRQRG